MCCHLLYSSLGMCCHLLCSSLRCIKNLQIVNAVLVESKNLVVEGLDFIKRCRLGKTFSSCFLSTCQPRVELLDSCPYSAQYLTSLEYLSHSIFVFSPSSVVYFV